MLISRLLYGAGENAEAQNEMVRSLLISFFLWTAISIQLYLIYLLLADYGETIFWAVLISLSIRPFQSATYNLIKTGKREGNHLLYTRNSYFVQIYCMTSVTRCIGSTGLTTKVMYALAGYILIRKVDPKTLISLVLAALLLSDLLLRLTADLLVFLFLKFCPLPTGKSTLFTLLSFCYMIAFLVIAMLVPVVICSVIGIELSKYGTRFFTDLDT
jgi:hypothetical protein